MAVFEALLRILERPTMVGVCTEMIMFVFPIWVAFVIGVMVGWAWKPNWASLGKYNLGCSSSKSLDLSSPSSKSPPLDNSPEKELSILPSRFVDYWYLEFVKLFWQL